MQSTIYIAYIYKGPALWNEIPSSISDVKSLITFKLLLQDFLVAND